MAEKEVNFWPKVEDESFFSPHNNSQGSGIFFFHSSGPSFAGGNGRRVLPPPSLYRTVDPAQRSHGGGYGGDGGGGGGGGGFGGDGFACANERPLLSEFGGGFTEDFGFKLVLVATKMSFKTLSIHI